MMNKEHMLRIVKTKSDDVQIDLTHNLQGRGAYVAKNSQAIKKAQKNNALTRALRMKVADTVYEELIAHLEFHG